MAEVPRDLRVLAINTGSSSLKAALYEIGTGDSLVASMLCERIGARDGYLRITDAHNKVVHEQRNVVRDQQTALTEVFSWLRDNRLDRTLGVVGHRVVYGGARYREPAIIDESLIAGLKQLIPLDPSHLPQAIDAIEFIAGREPELRQVACFDTAFHRELPDVAKRYALPRPLHDEGIVRYGFHGLSYEYVVSELSEIDNAAANGRLIVAHLGSGASMAAVRGGKSVDTSMGFTPVAGLMMGTRTGDLDPGVLLHLLHTKGLSIAAVDALINKESGLLGVSGSSADMQILLRQQAIDPRAREAVDLFCYNARKYLGAYVAVLGGLDTLVFTGGIGEHASEIREQVCMDLACFGIQLDTARNRANAAVISSDASPVTVRVIATNESRMVARHAAQLAAGQTH